MKSHHEKTLYFTFQPDDWNNCLTIQGRIQHNDLQLNFVMFPFLNYVHQFVNIFYIGPT